MASNEILHSTLETDLRMAVVLSQEIRTLLFDNASIRRSGAIRFAGELNGTMSDTARVRMVGLGGYDPFTSATEIEDVDETQLTDGGFTLALGRSALVRRISDLAYLTGTGPGDINPFTLAADMVESYEHYFNDLVSTTIATASTNVGTSGVDMSADDAFDAIYALEIANVPGPYFGVLHARQLADLQESIRSESGPNAFVTATQEMLTIRGSGYSGSWLGVEWFRSSAVTSAGGNREGAVWGFGAIEYAVGIPRGIEQFGTKVVYPTGTPIAIEFSRAPPIPTTNITGHAYTAVGIADQARIVGIVTDA